MNFFSYFLFLFMTQAKTCMCSMQEKIYEYPTFSGDGLKT